MKHSGSLKRGSLALGLLTAITLSASLSSAQTIPKTGVGLGGFGPYGGHYPFADLMKQASEWNDGQPTSGGGDVAAQYLDSNGYLTQFTPGQTAAWCWITYDNKEYRDVNATLRPNNPILTPGGSWVVTWDGDGSVHLIERNHTTSSPGTNVVLASGSDALRRKTYTVAAASELTLVMTSIGATRPTNIRVWLPGQEGNLFNTAWLNDLRKSNGTRRFEVLRFMSWGNTNYSTAQTWPAQRKLRSYRTWWTDPGNPGGVPYEVMLDLCNTLGSNMWVCVPERADDNYVTKLANLIRYGDDRGAAYNNDAQRLRDDLLVLVEYSNEVWNGQFTADDWVAANVTPPNVGSSTMNRYGKRAREVWLGVEAVMGDARTVNVLGCQAENSGIATGAAKGAEDRATPAPAVYIEAMAITFYFAHSLADDIWTNGWHTTNNKDAAFAALDASSTTTLNKLFAAGSYSDKGVAAAWSVPLIAYEGNCHLRPTNDTQRADGTFVNFIFDLYNDARMGTQLRKMIDRFDLEGARAICAFVDTGSWSKFGCWGFKRLPGQSTPGWSQLVSWAELASAPTSVTRHQAEYTNISGAVVVAGGGSQGSFVDYTAPNQYAQFTVNSTTAGSRVMVMRLANGRPSNYTSGWNISINGGAPTTVWTVNTGSWTTWANQNFTVNLNTGTNTIRITAMYDHSSHLDWVEVPNTTMH